MDHHSYDSTYFVSVSDGYCLGIRLGAYSAVKDGGSHLVDSNNPFRPESTIYLLVKITLNTQISKLPHHVFLF